MPAVASAPPIAPATVASATTAAIAAEPALAGRCPAASAFGYRRQTRSPGDMIVTLPGKRGASGFTASILGASTLGASSFGSLNLGRLDLGGVHLGRVGLGRGRLLIGRERRRLDLTAAAVTGSLGAGMSEAAGPAPRVPVSPLVGSGLLFAHVGFSRID